MGPHFMLLLSIYELYSNVGYIYPVSCVVEIKLFQIDCTAEKNVNMPGGLFTRHMINFSVFTRVLISLSLIYYI